jgi:chromate transporter
VPPEAPAAANECSAGAWRTWLLIGATGFGGPAGQVAILHREVVERRRWLSEDEFLAALRLCMMLPGPEAQQLATYAGWRIGGLAGGLLAGTLFVLPGALLVTALAWLHAVGGSVPLIATAFAGTRPAVVALVFLAAWRIGRKSLRTATAVALAVAAAAALAAGCSFPLVVAVVGIGAWILPLNLVAGGGKSGGGGEPAAADSVRTQGLRHAVITALVAAAIWAAAYGVVCSRGLAGGRGGAIAALFTETTLLSLGGAYAVVPWALDESLARGWLDQAERFDALAMGEATPGPLILVVTFIGFLAGWKTQPGGAALAGLEGATIATLFAFIPSFAMVLGLAPLVRSIHAGSRLGRAMTAIGAVVVAAIALLALKLSAEAFVLDGRFDLLAALVAVACGWALVRGLASTPLVVIGAAAFAVLAAVLSRGLSQG